MDFLELCENRYSSRKYLDRSVEREKIDRCLEASRLAPSAINAQPWSFIVIDEPNLKEIIARETYDNLSSSNKFTLNAPVLVVVVNENPVITGTLSRLARSKDYTIIDAGIVTSHFCLKATEEGLGTCIIGYFNENNIKKKLKIPKNKSISLIISVGYPADTKRRKNRKALEDIRRYNI